MGNLDQVDLIFIVFLVFSAAALVYTVFAWLQAVTRWRTLCEESVLLQREANSLLRDISRKLDRDEAA